MDQFILDKQEEYHRKAKYADAKLRKLEKRAVDENNSEYLRYAYSEAMRDIESHGGRRRFDIKPPSDPWELQRMIADVDKFLDKPTSGVRGFQRIQKSRVSKFNESLGVNFSVREFTQFMETGLFDILVNAFGFGYRTAVRIAKQLMRNKKNIVNRRSPFSPDQVYKILNKYKFVHDRELYNIVQGRIN